MKCNCANVHVGPIFGSIEVHTRFFDPKKAYVVNYLQRDDALKINRIMHGYGVVQEKKIDCSALDSKELATMLDKLGEESAC